MNKQTAIKIVGKALGESYFNIQMNGGFEFGGSLTECEIIKLIFGGNIKEIEKKLRYYEKQECDRLFREQHERAKAHYAKKGEIKNA